ncbi:MAG: DUF4197 domain-containing protein [Chitinophagaceae bacterium]|nr:DUF4197 domain-containing protein [Chitinophagaceae bacterium]
MKKITALLLLNCTLFLYSCTTLQNAAANILSERDAINAIKEMLTIGASNGNALINKNMLMDAVLPQELSKVLQTLQQLGLSNEVERFSGTITNAATQTATNSIPIFISGIKRMNIRDAINIVKNGGTAATDYLRATVGDSLRTAVTPIMRTSLNEYKIADEWNRLIGPAKLALGNKANLNLNIDNLLAGVVTNAMFNKIAEQETVIRTKAEARTTQLLQKVFGRTWN